MSMDGTILFGILALVLGIASLCCMKRKPGLAIIAGVLTLAAVYLSGHFWCMALAESGKSTALLGFAQYPAAPVILSVCAVFGLAGIVAGTVNLVRKKPRAGGETAQSEE